MSDTRDTSDVSEAAPEHVCNVVEAALLAAGEPVSLERLTGLFKAEEGVGRAEIRSALAALDERLAARGIEVKEVASGYRLQVRESLSPWIGRLWEQKPPRYSRALLETLALIAYQQPVTRGDIEQVRGVSVSTNIIKTLLDRDWIRIVGHRDVPGRPALYGTTRAFLDHFNLKSLDELPPLAEVRDLANVNPELGFEESAAATEGDAAHDTAGYEAAADAGEQAPGAATGAAEEPAAEGAPHAGSGEHDAEADGEPSSRPAGEGSRHSDAPVDDADREDATSADEPESRPSAQVVRLPTDGRS